MEPLPAAQALVASAFPDALAAFLGGNVLSARRTATSDLDILVVVPGPPAPYRETIRYGSARPSQVLRARSWRTTWGDAASTASMYLTTSS